MRLLDLYINAIRIIMMIFTAYFIYKKQYKIIISTGTVFAATFLLVFLDKIFKIKVDIVGSYLYITIITMTMFLGNAFKFYDKFAWWDRLIHFLSGIVFVSFAVAISKNAEHLEKLHTLFFGFTYAVSHHVLWEVMEYLSDCLFRSDNQRWQKKNKTVNHVSPTAIQPAGLVDTMNDTIICIIGTLAACTAWWFFL